MRERVESDLLTPFEELRVATFHSFCARLLRDEALEAGLDPFFSPVTPADRLALLLERIDDLTLRRHEIRGNPAPLLASFLVADRPAEGGDGRPAEYHAYARAAVARGRGRRRRRAPGARASSSSRGLYADHDALLRRARRARLRRPVVLHAFELLHEQAARARAGGARFEHVLVDEFQDATFAQGSCCGCWPRSTRA